MTSSISLWAGKKAYSRIKEKGISPDDVKTVAGAAGGPKWLILSHLDRAIFTSWLNSRKSKLFLVGSSIGAWRLATISRNNPADAIDAFQAAYLKQVFGYKPSMDKVNRIIEKVLDRLLACGGGDEILSHPYNRLNIMTVRCKRNTDSDDKTRLVPALAAAAIANVISRKNLGVFFERTLFYDPRDKPPFFSMKGFPVNRVPLTAENIKPALMASGSVPLLMPGVKDIPGAPSGVYRDGGILDYHMNIDFSGSDEGIVLYPHYTRQIAPGWLDKKLFWRRPDYSVMDWLLMIAPSKEFTASLPYGKISDRSDFTTFVGQDEKRIAYWKTVIDMGRRLADEFMEAVQTGKIKDMIKLMHS